MPYLKCSPCRLRVAVAATQDETGFPYSCPQCCGSLESVDRLSDLMGFRRFDADATPSEVASDASSRLAGAVARAMPGRDAAMAQATLDPEGWFHDGQGKAPRGPPGRGSEVSRFRVLPLSRTTSEDQT